MSNEADEQACDTFDSFKDIAVEQLANMAQLASEAQRLGLIPEVPRELLEKLDLGGTLMDLLRLQLKHATALVGIARPQAKSLEKLNQLSAMMVKGRSSRQKDATGTRVAGQVGFELHVDNPLERPQKVRVELGRLHRLDGSGAPVRRLHQRGTDDPDAASLETPIEWELNPAVEEVDALEVRTLRIVLYAPPTDPNALDGEFEATAVVRLSPLGLLRRYRLYLPR